MATLFIMMFGIIVKFEHAQTKTEYTTCTYMDCNGGLSIQSVD